MDIIELLKTVSAAVEDAKGKETAALSASQHLEAVKAEAQAAYDQAVGAAEQAHRDAEAAYRDAQVAGQRLKAQANDALGGIFAPADPRVRMG